MSIAQYPSGVFSCVRWSRLCSMEMWKYLMTYVHLSV